MSSSFRMFKLLSAIVLIPLLAACAPEVGSPKWCKAIEAKSAGELTMNEAKDYAKFCVFK